MGLLALLFFQVFSNFSSPLFRQKKKGKKPPFDFLLPPPPKSSCKSLQRRNSLSSNRGMNKSTTFSVINMCISSCGTVLSLLGYCRITVQFFKKYIFFVFLLACELGERQNPYPSVTCPTTSFFLSPPFLFQSSGVEWLGMGRSETGIAREETSFSLFANSENGDSNIWAKKREIRTCRELLFRIDSISRFYLSFFFGVYQSASSVFAINDCSGMTLQEKRKEEKETRAISPVITAEKKNDTKHSRAQNSGNAQVAFLCFFVLPRLN